MIQQTEGCIVNENRALTNKLGDLVLLLVLAHVQAYKTFWMSLARSRLVDILHSVSQKRGRKERREPGEHLGSGIIHSVLCLYNYAPEHHVARVCRYALFVGFL